MRGAILLVLLTLLAAVDGSAFAEQARERVPQRVQTMMLQVKPLLTQGGSKWVTMETAGVQWGAIAPAEVMGVASHVGEGLIRGVPPDLQKKLLALLILTRSLEPAGYEPQLTDADMQSEREKHVDVLQEISRIEKLISDDDLAIIKRLNG